MSRDDIKKRFKRAIAEARKHCPEIGATVDGTVVDVGQWDNGKSAVSRVVVSGDNRVLFTLLGATDVPVEEISIGARVLLQYSSGGGSGYGAVVEGKAEAPEIERGGHWRLKAKI
jgi:hypothetical protein